MAKRVRLHEAAPEDSALEAKSFASTISGLAPSPEFEAALAETFVALGEQLKEVFGEDAWVLTFGSIIQGVHLDGSDLDVCFDVPGQDIHATEEVDGTDNSKQVAALKKVVSNLHGKFRVIETRFWKNMKVPILILGYRNTSGIEVEADLSVGTVFEEVEKGNADRCIRRLLAHCPKALHMSRVVKLWAKVEQLNKAYDGFLNSLGWTLLVLYFCIEKLYVSASLIYGEEPNERGPGGDNVELPPPLHAGEAHGGFLSEEDQLQQVPSCEELAEFFGWLASWETWWPEGPTACAPDPRCSTSTQTTWGLSIVDGAIMEVRAPSKVVQDQKVWPDSSSFFIEDPGVRLVKGTSENVARSLKTGTWATILERCGTAAATLRKAAEDENVGLSWVSDLVQRDRNDKNRKNGFQRQRFPPFGAGGFGEPAPKKANIGVCRWFLKDECWNGDRCKNSHDVG
eukprot:TRINITY_DN69957_c0_g1_i1.p1 TRINITY_DN69957_c0_g1~~TRINITY_DN69957_c0_g1_i1.p1  ORF type:complete len:456 (-),score=69.23 TRINITY_DN69957_c0_g1_i1:375-1742(-)